MCTILTLALALLNGVFLARRAKSRREHARILRRIKSYCRPLRPTFTANASGELTP